MNNSPYLVTDNRSVNRAYRMAISNLFGNIMPFKDGILENAQPCILAGLGYSTPWTRDTAINTWNAGGLVCPEVALNTLKAVMGRDEKGYFIDGEYWDRIIWTIGAWQYYVYTGDMDFLSIAYEAVENSLEYFENTEFNEELNLFRGPACYGDGVAAYPDIYSQHGQSGIITFATENKDLCDEKGVGIPMYALSTNCLYYYSYVLADKMAGELGYETKYEAKAQKMYDAVNAVFWNEEKGTYNYLYDNFGGCDYQEGLGISFAVLFGIADERKRELIFKNYKTTEFGIPCVYPSFARYDTPDGLGFGRHSGTVWPHVQGFWADAAALSGKTTIFDKEFTLQTENAVRYYQFAEIYHPTTGEIYGGRQERWGKGISVWNSEPHQTWSATAYLHNVYCDLVGMNFTTKGINFAPTSTEFINKLELKNFKYRNAVINITISGKGKKIKSFKINGEISEPFIPCDAEGTLLIEIELEEK